MSMTVRNLIIVFAAVSVASVAADSFDLRVMTFNVRYGTAEDGPNAWEHRKDLLIKTIADAAPDVIGTQECLDFQAQYIVEQLTEYAWFGVGREADGSGEHMAVFYRKSLLEPIESGHFWLSESPDTPGSMSWNTACTRMVTWLRFRHLPSATVVHFYNTHLDHRSAPARVKGVQLIASRLAELEPGVPLVLTGDFNCVGGASDPWQALADAGMVDAWVNCGERSGPAGTWCGFMAPEANSDRRIDWILVRGPVEVLEISTLTHNENGRFPSDHFPVCATVRVGIPAASLTEAPG